MDGTAAVHEADQILGLPDRISDVIKPFARQSPDHPALVQGDVTWTYAELAARVADTVAILKLYEIRPGDRVMLISENSLALVALILAVSEIDAWSVVVNPRLSAREVDLIREHSGARRVLYTIEVSDAARRTRNVTTPRLPCSVGWERSASGRSTARPCQSRSRWIGRAGQRRSSIPRARRAIPRA